MNNKAIISIDLNITRFTNDMYDNLLNMISQREDTNGDNIDIYLYNYIPKKYPYVTEGNNVNIFNYNGSKKKVALDIFQSLNTLSECLMKGYNTVYLLCGAVDRDILINVLQNLGIKVVLLVQENSSTSMCQQLIIDRIHPNVSDISTQKGISMTENSLNSINLSISDKNNSNCGQPLTESRSNVLNYNDNFNGNSISDKKEFLFKTNIQPNANPKMIDAENKLKILLDALTKSKSNSLKDEYEKLIHIK